ncbi:hypothetical protein ACLBXJ_02635 [Methylobacterium mesophilicum]|nr:hypothetical protein [Methylobacterium mesophilicum]
MLYLDRTEHGISLIETPSRKGCESSLRQRHFVLHREVDKGLDYGLAGSR